MRERFSSRRPAAAAAARRGLALYPGTPWPAGHGAAEAPARGAALLELDERPADELRDELPNYDS
jgi:hypothetical protein